MQNHSPTILGLMSGTSMDGLDLALCSFQETPKGWEYVIHAGETIPYPPEWIERLSKAGDLDAIGLVNLDIDYGRYLGQKSVDFLRRRDLKADYIASHGHTLFHRPELGFTFQAGNGASLAAAGRIPVICDFRTQDVAMGGQGAPLVPIGDALLFSSYDYCLNLGGFSNISYQSGSKRLAFDISPCNIVLNALAARVGMVYDPGGKLASSGRIEEDLLHRLDSLEYYTKSGPKSLGREWVEKEFLPLMAEFQLDIPDLLRTVTEHISKQIANATLIAGSGRVLVTGGGARNDFLIDQIRIKTSSDLIIPDSLSLDFKEALIFAFLGLRRIQGHVNVLSSVTGSSEDHCAGAIYLP